MAITYPLNFPYFNNILPIQKMTMRLNSSVAVQQSPYSYAQQVQDFGGMRWEAEVTLRPLTHSESLKFQAFFASLNGSKGTFILGNQLFTSNDFSGDISINGSGVSAGDVEIPITIASGHSITNGQMFEINNRLHMFLDSATAGNTTVDIRPPLRANVPDNTSLQTDLPEGTWRLASNKIDWDISTAGLYSFTFACVEAL